MDGSPNRRNKVAFLNSSGVVCICLFNTSFLSSDQTTKISGLNIERTKHDELS